MKWQDAENECRNRSGNLAAVTFDYINNDLVALMKASNVGQAWIGARVEVGEWTWLGRKSFLEFCIFVYSKFYLKCSDIVVLFGLELY